MKDDRIKFSGDVEHTVLGYVVSNGLAECPWAVRASFEALDHPRSQLGERSTGLVRLGVTSGYNRHLKYRSDPVD